MRKLIVALVIFTLLILPTAFAQNVPASDFKTTLISAIVDYLTSQTPKLEKNELKDLIVVYLTSSGSSIDLSKTGQYSGKNIETVYNKFKGGCGTCPTGQTCINGKCSSITIKDLTPNYVQVRRSYMCGIDSGESVRLGETKYYRIDMKKWIEWQRVVYPKLPQNDPQVVQNQKTYEQIYRTGDYVTFIPLEILVGCSIWSQTRWGCEGGRAKLEIAVGYNKVPVYEELDFSDTKGYAAFGKELNDTDPIVTMFGLIDCPDGGGCASDSDLYPSVYFNTQTHMIGADYVYIMVHNKAVFDPVPYEWKYSGDYTRNVKIIINCPLGYRKCHADADCVKCPNSGCFTNMDLLRWQGISVNSDNCPDMGLETYTFDCICGNKNFCTITNLVKKPLQTME